MKRLEGNGYIHRSCIRTDAFRTTPLPGLFFYKGFYLWTHLRLPGASRLLAWRYVLLFPWGFFLWGRVGLPGNHPELTIEEDPGVETSVQPSQQALTHDGTDRSP